MAVAIAANASKNSIDSQTAAADTATDDLAVGQTYPIAGVLWESRRTDSG